MGIQIEDGTGSGKSVKINKNNQIVTYSVTESENQWANEEGNAYKVLIHLTPSSINPSSLTQDSVFYYMKNEDERLLTISKIKVWVESNEIIDIYAGQTGTPVGGESITPNNLNLNSGNSADGTFLASSSITGISGGNFIDRLRVAADNQDHIYTWFSNLFIPRNYVFTLSAVNGSIPVEVSISFHYYELT